MSDDIDYDWGMAPRPLKPLPQVARLTAERDEWRAKCVKACVDLACVRYEIEGCDAPYLVAFIKQEYGIVLRETETTFEEDTTK